MFNFNYLLNRIPDFSGNSGELYVFSSRESPEGGTLGQDDRYLSLEAEDGTDTTLFSDGTIARADFDEVSSERQGIVFLLSSYF